MKKMLFFAIVLAFGTLAFNSCNQKRQNNPTDPQEEEQAGKDSTAVNPTDVMAEDIIGDWRIDSTINEFQNEYNRSLISFTDQFLVINGDSTLYIYQPGAISGSRISVDPETGKNISSPFSWDIISFNRGEQPAMVLREREVPVTYWSEEEQRDIDTVADTYYYMSMLPEITGVDMEITEENVMGAWFEEYTEFQQNPYPMSKGVQPHYMFYYFGEDHAYTDLMMVDPQGGFQHPGFWKFENGKVAYRSASSGESYDDIDWVHINWYNVDKLTDKYMVLHTTWNDGEEILYLSRTELPETGE